MRTESVARSRILTLIFYFFPILFLILRSCSNSKILKFIKNQSENENGERGLKSNSYADFLLHSHSVSHSEIMFVFQNLEFYKKSERE